MVAAPARYDRNAVKYTKDQWSESFEGQLSILRPHLTPRVLTTMCLAAWQQFGKKDIDPINAAREWAASMSTKAPPSGSAKP
jgi:hypothetical protein